MLFVFDSVFELVIGPRRLIGWWAGQGQLGPAGGAHAGRLLRGNLTLTWRSPTRPRGTEKARARMDARRGLLAVTWRLLV